MDSDAYNAINNASETPEPLSDQAIQDVNQQTSECILIVMMIHREILRCT